MSLQIFHVLCSGQQSELAFGDGCEQPSTRVQSRRVHIQTFNRI